MALGTPVRSIDCLVFLLYGNIVYFVIINWVIDLNYSGARDLSVHSRVKTLLFCSELLFRLFSSLFNYPHVEFVVFVLGNIISCRMILCKLSCNLVYKSTKRKNSDRDFHIPDINKKILRILIKITILSLR